MQYLIKGVAILAFLLSTISSVAQKTILWSVKNPGGNHTSYLLGTYHYIGNSFVDSLPEIKSGILASDVVVFESIATKEKIEKFLNDRADDFSYRTYLKEEDLTYMEELSSTWSVPISKVTPVLLLMKLQETYFVTQCGTVKTTDELKHFDHYLQHIATINGKTLVGLETDTLMFEHLHSEPTSQNWASMKGTIDDWLENIRKGKGKKNWCRDGIDYMNFSFNYQLNEVCGDNPLLKSRNEKWLTKLPDLLANNNCFVAVGLLHLFGDCGLITQLRKIGYVVEPIFDLGTSNSTRR